MPVLCLLCVSKKEISLAFLLYWQSEGKSSQNSTPAVRARQISMALLMIPDKIQLSRQKTEQVQRSRRQRRPRAAGGCRKQVHLPPRAVAEVVWEQRAGAEDEK